MCRNFSKKGALASSDSTFSTQRSGQDLRGSRRSNKFPVLNTVMLVERTPMCQQTGNEHNTVKSLIYRPFPTQGCSHGDVSSAANCGDTLISEQRVDGSASTDGSSIRVNPKRWSYCIKLINYCLLFFSLSGPPVSTKSLWFLEAVDTEFAGHELAKSPACGVCCDGHLCNPGTLGSPKQQVLWVLRTFIGVGLLLAASQLPRV